MAKDGILTAQIGRRRSIRRYRAARVPRVTVRRLLAAASRAPSAHNRQPWRFAVLDDIASKSRLAEAMGTRLRQDRTADGDDAAAIDADVARSQARITSAPVVIVFCIDLADMDKYPDPRRSDAEHVMAVQSTAMAAQNLLLAAQGEGLGACVMCAPLFCPDTVVAALQLSPAWRPQMLVTLGAPDSEGKERPRLPLDAVTMWTSRARPRTTE
jgi:F420 biosynthesis protein FbiB-like protein